MKSFPFFPLQRLLIHFISYFLSPLVSYSHDHLYSFIMTNFTLYSGFNSSGCLLLFPYAFFHLFNISFTHPQLFTVIFPFSPSSLLSWRSTSVSPFILRLSPLLSSLFHANSITHTHTLRIYPSLLYITYGFIFHCFTVFIYYLSHFSFLSKKPKNSHENTKKWVTTRYNGVFFYTGRYLNTSRNITRIIKYSK